MKNGDVLLVAAAAAVLGLVVFRSRGGNQSFSGNRDSWEWVTSRNPVPSNAERVFDSGAPDAAAPVVYNKSDIFRVY